MAKEEEKSVHISYRQSPIYSGRSWGPLLFITGAFSFGHALIFTIGIFFLLFFFFFLFSFSPSLLLLSLSVSFLSLVFEFEGVSP